MDERITALLEEPDEIEKEAFETEVLQDEIDESSLRISNFFNVLSSKKAQSPASSVTVGKSLFLPHGNTPVEVPHEVIIINPH